MCLGTKRILRHVNGRSFGRSSFELHDSLH
jgi:hypothetical protein